MKIPTTNGKVLTDYITKKKQLQSEYRKGLIGISTLRVEVRNLNQKYSQFINFGDRYFFNTLEELADELIQFGFSKESTQLTLEHEKAHTNKARELGFDVFYLVWLTKEDRENSYSFAIATCLNLEQTTLLDSYAIAHAPEKPSSLDKLV